MKREGILFILCGPAGAGKTTISNYLVDNFPPCSFSISVTSRLQRSGEIPGESYSFVSREEFNRKIDNGEFFEYEEVHGNFYGTLKSSVQDSLSNGVDLLLDIDIKGALTFKNQVPNNSVAIFIVPPSGAILKERLFARGSISSEELSRRLRTAEVEYETVNNLLSQNKIDYFLVNDKLSDTCNLVSQILIAERMKLIRLNNSDINAICKI